MGEEGGGVTDEGGGVGVVESDADVGGVAVAESEAETGRFEGSPSRAASVSSDNILALLYLTEVQWNSLK